MVFTLGALFSTALWQTNDYANTQNWSHTNSSGVTFSERVRSLGLDKGSGEVLYKGECSISNAVELWIKSPTHLEVISNKDYKYMVAIMSPDGKGDCYLVVNYSK